MTDAPRNSDNKHLIVFFKQKQQLQKAIVTMRVTLRKTKEHRYY